MYFLFIAFYSYSAQLPIPSELIPTKHQYPIVNLLRLCAGSSSSSIMATA